MPVLLQFNYWAADQPAVEDSTRPFETRKV